MFGRFPSIVGLLSVMLASGRAPADAATLRGTARDTTGAPVASATVSLWEAAPLRGTGILCPSCYPDCARRVRTGRDGRFEVAGLDDSLAFRVLVVAKGFRPSYVDSVVPAAGPISARLVPRDLTAVPDSHLVRGVVRDRRGYPLAGALVRPVGFRIGGLQAFGWQGGDPIAVTDDRGEFDLVTYVPDRQRLAAMHPRLPDSAVVWYCRVEARGFAPSMARDLPAGRRRTAIELTPGAGVSGRVMRDGHPLAGVVVAACQQDRNAAGFVGFPEVATDSAGRFFIGNLLPCTRYQVYGRMRAFAALGAAPALALVTPDDDSTASLGVLAPGPMRRLSGRVTFEDGGHPPAGSRVGLSRAGGFDAVELPTDSGGRFAFDALPAESLEVIPPRLGRHMDPATPGLQRYGPERVRVADRGDVELELLLLPGLPATRWAAPARETTKAVPPGR